MAYKHQLVVDPQRKPTGNYLLKNIAVKRNTTAMPPSPFDNPNIQVEHHEDHSGFGLSNMWGALRGQQVHHSHVHEVASDVMLKTKSDYMIKDESKRTGLASLGISEMFFGPRTASQQQLTTTTAETNSAEIATDLAHIAENGTPAHGGVVNGKAVNLHIDTMQATTPTRANSTVIATTPVPSTSTGE